MSQPETTRPSAPETRPREEGEKEVRPGKPREVNGPKGPEPTRYGDWEKNGRCIDF